MATVAHEQFDWTDERVAFLRKRIAEGVGPSAIARELRGHNLIPTRNAVLGKLSRLGLRVGASIKAKRTRQSCKAQVKTQKASTKPRPPAQAPRCVALPPLMLAGGKTIGILDVDDSMCRYPVGDPAKSDFAFCGRRPSGERPYCIDHVRLCYEKPRKSPEMSAIAKARAELTQKLREATA